MNYLFPKRERATFISVTHTRREAAKPTLPSFCRRHFIWGGGYCSAVLCQVSCTALSHCQLVCLDIQMKCCIKEVQSDVASGCCPSSGHIKGLVSHHSSADLLFGFVTFFSVFFLFIVSEIEFNVLQVISSLTALWL